MGPLIVATSLGQSGCGFNANERIIHLPKISRLAYTAMCHTKDIAFCNNLSIIVVCSKLK